jgi:hypothetical protein
MQIPTSKEFLKVFSVSIYLEIFKNVCKLIEGNTVSRYVHAIYLIYTLGPGFPIEAGIQRFSLSVA